MGGICSRRYRSDSDAPPVTTRLLTSPQMTTPMSTYDRENRPSTTDMDVGELQDIAEQEPDTARGKAAADELRRRPF